MKESVVLLVSITPTCTELARHLVLSGINLQILASQDKVTSQDPQDDFLYARSDIGQNVKLTLVTSLCRNAKF